MRPFIHADFCMIDGYSYSPQEPLAVPMTAFGGSDDPHVDEAGLEAWSRQTTRAFECQVFPGDHFFLNGHRQAIVRSIADAIR